MKDFLITQLDYIYFFYGLSFFIMGLVCFILERDKKRKFPWELLGSFGLVHSLSEWVDMLMITGNGNQLIRIIGFCALAISFFCLFEFARNGLWRLKNKKISPWFYLPALLLVASGYRYGLSGLSVTTRYFLGFPSAYLAARILYEFSRQEKMGKRALITLSLILSLYAVSTGLIVPKLPYFPANLLNFDTFQAAFGIPAQLIRGMLALGAALSIWFYSTVIPNIEYQPLWRPTRFLPTKWMIALIIAILICAGWLFTNYLDLYAEIRLTQRGGPNTGSLINKLNTEIDTLRKTADSISRVGAIKNAVVNPNARYIEAAETVLRNFKNKNGALDCVLLDARGKPIAGAEPENASVITSDKAYIHRPYFTAALSGLNGYYVSSLPAYDQRLYYVSSPVKNTAQKVIGMVVIVKNIRAEPLFQYRLFGIIITFIVCMITIAFFIALRKRELTISYIEGMHSKLRQIDSMKNDFISVVSHELRTPLTSIKNAASILLRGGPSRQPIDERQKELLRIINDNVDRQSRMVSDLLDVSRIESGAMSITLEPVDLDSLIKSAITSLKPQAENKKINLEFSDNFPGITVYADTEHVRRILNNLIVNAIKFTHEGGCVTVKTQGSPDEAIIAVVDNGIGISQADKQKLFDKFCDILAPQARKNKGCGLGLAITKGLVEAQKGRIWVESETDKGSAFYFTLPVTQATG